MSEFAAIGARAVIEAVANDLEKGVNVCGAVQRPGGELVLARLTSHRRLERIDPAPAASSSSSPSPVDPSGVDDENRLLADLFSQGISIVGASGKDRALKTDHEAN